MTNKTITQADGDLGRKEEMESGASSAELRDTAIRAAEHSVYQSYAVDPKERRLSVDTGCGSVEVRLMEFGTDESKPAVVLLHGIASATVLSASLLVYLRNRKVVAVDWPGHGLSGQCIVSPHVGIRAHAVTTIASLLDHLQLEVVDLVGHSLGAQFSLYAAHDLSHRVRRVVLLGAPGAAFDGVTPVPVMRALAMPVLGRALLSVPMPRRTFRHNQTVILGADAFDNAPPELAEALYLIAGRRANAASIASLFNLLIGGWSIRRNVSLSLEELGGLTQPVMSVWGDNDVFQSPTRAAESLTAIRDLNLVRMPTAGHAPWLQDEATVGHALTVHLAP
jgi:pimeloyl-ACP methyl ester carboxylesterase